MKRLILLGIVLLLCWGGVKVILPELPPQWDPFRPLSVTDAPTLVTRYKLKQLATDPDACLAVLQQAQAKGYISFTRPGSQSGQCPLVDPVRITRFGDVTLSGSFLSSCALAVSSTMMVTQTLKPLAASELGSPLVRIDHFGSFACRNIYHRAQGRLSEHATAEAWDISGFRLQNGRRISVLNHWSEESDRGRWLHAVFASSCPLFGTALGPDYNAAHANHFHFDMRSFGLCR